MAIVLYFVTFHVTPPASADALHPNTNLDERTYAGLIDLMFRSTPMCHRQGR